MPFRTVFRPKRRNAKTFRFLHKSGEKNLERDDPLNEQAPPIYNYQSLEDQPDHIRVLVLHENKEELTCEIRHCSVHSDIPPKKRLQYIALSYEWGTPDKIHRIHVIGNKGQPLGIIPITKSLNDALCDIRDSGLSPKVVFADQVSINQVDKLELNHQVLHMGRVYRQAYQVVTYLGPKKDGDDEGFQLVDIISRHFQPHWEYLWYVDSNLKHSEERQQLDRLVLQVDERHPGWMALQQMMWGAWTQRRWMIPENVVNKSTLFLRGQHTIPWMAMVGLHVISYLDLLVPLRQLHNRHSYGAKRWSRTALTIWEFRNHAPWYTLLYSLTSFSSSVCSDGKDMVYALLPISRDSKDLALMPNYATDTTDHDVFIDLALRCISVYDKIFLVGIAEQFPSTRPEWESWLPDWTAQKNGLYPFSSRHHQSKAALKFPSEANILLRTGTRERAICLIRGLLIDQIDVVISKTPFSSKIQSAGLRVEREKQKLREFRGTLNSARRRGFSDDTIASTIIGLSTWAPSSNYLDSSPGSALRAYVSCMKHEFNQGSQPAALSTSPTENETGLSKIFADNVKMARKRHLFGTEGDRLCLGHPKAKTGDVLVIAFGAEELFILRPRDDGHFTLIGNAWILGFMEGKWTNPPYAIQEFSLI
jgi:heterokaryon incompatibility protein (HET)